MGHKQILFAYLLLVNIFPSHDWFICLRFSLILIYATLSSGQTITVILH